MLFVKKNDSTYLRLIRAAKKVSKALSKELGDNLLATYVYGSLARGDYRKSSDVDLHIVLEDYAQADDIPHTKWIGNIPVGVSPHPLAFYKTTPEWILENIDTTAGWEGLWELAKIIVLYDPDNLVSSFQEKITPILNNESLLKARANISFKVAKTEAAKAEKELSEGTLDQAICHMYALGGGGDAYSGAAVHVLKTIVKFSGLPLTTQRIWLRFTEACHKLNKSELQNLLEDCYGMDQLNQENLQEIVNETYNLVNDVIAKSLVPPEVIYNLERFKLAIAEHLERGEIGAAYVYILGGFSSYFLGLSSEGWQKQIRPKLGELLCKASRIRSQRELDDRLKILKIAMNKIQKDLLSN
jgi:hypothetical protein